MVDSPLHTDSGLPHVGVHDLHRNWGWLAALGALLIILGTFAVCYSVLATLTAVAIFGWLLIIGGALEAGHGVWRRRWSGFFLDLFSGILYSAIGFLIVSNPAASAESLTLLLSLFLLFGGIFRIVVALSNRFHNWGWLLLSGVIDLLLVAAIWQQWPVSGLVMIGLFIGIDMIFNGWSLVALALAVRSLPARAATA